MSPWILASRPKTLAGAAVPVMIGCAYAWHLSDLDMFRIVPAILCFLFAFTMQIAANFINDYYDCVKGRDNEERLGPERACQQGWISLKSMRKAIIITLAIAGVIGLPLTYFGGWELIILGAACMLFCILYTTCLAQVGMGDILVILFFGIVPVVFTCYVIVPHELQHLGIMPWNLGIATGLVIDTLLIINNYRDIEIDRKTGKKTIIVLIGKKAAEYLYMALVPIALVMIILQFGYSNVNIIICFIVYFMHVNTWSTMKRIGQGRELNKVLGQTARNIFIYGVMTTILILLA